MVFFAFNCRHRSYNCVVGTRVVVIKILYHYSGGNVLCLIPGGFDARTYRNAELCCQNRGRESRQCVKVSMRSTRILSAVNESVEDVKERVWESDVHSFDDNTAI